MSYIITRRQEEQYQIYFDVGDIYGIGKFKTNEDAGLCDLPMVFDDLDIAAARARREKEQDPSWVYMVSFYDR